MQDFNFANAEFDRQTAILDNLVEIITTTSAQDPANPVNISGRLLPTVTTGGQNTMAAAGIVLLAAHFEEYIRQQIEEYAKGVIKNYDKLESSLQEKLADSYWRSAASKLSRIRPKGSSTWMNTAQITLNSLLGYPVSGNISQFNFKLISEHENNMRYETILELCKRLSISDIHTGMCRHTDFDNSLGNPHRDFRAREITRTLNDFYELRNGIIHSIAQNVGVGQPTFRRWTEFFRLFATAFAKHLDRSYTAFEASL